jgi:hypothetical protein
MNLREALKWSRLAAGHAFKPAQEQAGDLEKEMAASGVEEAVAVS